MQIERLESNWYSTAADVVSMSEVGLTPMATLPHPTALPLYLVSCRFSPEATSLLLRLVLVQLSYPMQHVGNRQKYAACSVHMCRANDVCALTGLAALLTGRSSEPADSHEAPSSAQGVSTAKCASQRQSHFA